MKICKKCGCEFSIYTKIDGKARNLKNRTKCLDCLSFGESPYSRRTEEQKLAARRDKVKKYYHKKRTVDGYCPITYRSECRKQQIIDIIGGCQMCGYDKLQRNLSFHHLRDKEFGINVRAFQHTPDKILDEIRKCILVCHNCHGEIHGGMIEEIVIKSAHDILLQKLKDMTGFTKPNYETKSGDSSHGSSKPTA